MINQQVILLIFFLFISLYAQHSITIVQQPHRIRNRIATNPIILANSYMTLTFDSAENGFGLLGVKMNSENYNFLATPSYEYPTPTLWNIEFVTREGFQYWVDNQFECESKEYKIDKLPDGSLQLTLKWIGLTVGNEKNAASVTVTVTLKDAQARFRIKGMNKVDKFTIWVIHFVIVGNIITSKTPEKDVLITPNGYGESYANYARTAPSIDAKYPSWSACMQYYSIIHHGAKGLYYGAHDGNGYTKSFIFNPDIYKGVVVNKTDTHQPRSQIYVIHYPEHMGKYRASFELSYDIVISVFKGDWWDSAQIYRSFILPNAQWTKRGNVMLREDIPKWFKETTLWINSCWEAGALECDHGDPKIVQQRMSGIRKVFSNSSMALHWYCYSQKQFDTDYPQFLPAKDGFKETALELQKMRIKVVPYINARLFDFNAEIWNDDSQKCSTKYRAPRLGAPTMQPYIEVYGSGQSQAIMCPTTKFWQETISDIVSELTNKLGVDGVYLDQIAAAHAKLCFDESHGHPAGGGNYWLKGFQSLLDTVTKKSPGSMLITDKESNTEIYMDRVYSYLTLSAFEKCNAVQAFLAVYGGYFISVGRIFYPTDLLYGDGIGFSFKMGNMFVNGAQLGWMGLGGGYGMFDLLMSNNFTIYANYVNLLSQYRILGLKYLQGGRLMRPLSITSPTVSFSKTGGWKGVGDCVFPLIQSAVWQTFEKNEIGLVFTNVSPTQSISIQFNFEVEKYEFKATDRLKVRQLTLQGSRDLGEYVGLVIPVKHTLQPLSVFLISITKL